MPRNTKIQLRRGTAAEWLNGGLAALDVGEIGYEIDTGRFKIGKSGVSLWSQLPYAGGSTLIANSGIGLILDTANNAYTVYSVITGVTGGQDGITFETLPLSGLLNNIDASGTYYRIGLSNKLENFHDLAGSGIIVQDVSGTGFFARSLSSGSNINITNGNGVAANPIIGLSSSLTGLNSISGVNNFTIASNSGINFNAGDGVVSVDDLTVNGETNLNGNINISLAAQIIATQAIVYSGTPTIFAGNVIFDTLPKVGPTGNNGANATGVSLEGHEHVYSDITDFCDGVASCVDTAFVASTGIQLNYSNDTLNIALSGQALRLHNLNTDGLIVRSGDNILARTITPSGSNIVIGNGDGVGSNPIVGLNPNPTVQSLTTSGTLNVGTNLTVDGNLTINGDTVITNVSIIEVEDPSIRIGGTSGTLAVGDLKDRGIEFVYQTGNSVPITGFFGYDHSDNAFVFLNNVNATGSYAGTSSLLNVGGLYSTGGVSGTILTSTTAQGGVSPIVVSSSGLVTNLNSDYLDGQDGSYYINAGNLTGTLPSGQLPSITAFSITASSPTSGYRFINNLTVDSAGRLLSATSGTIPTATSADLGLAKFSTDNFAVDVNGSVTIKDNGVILGTETSGQYAQSLTVSGTGLSATDASADDGTAYTITINATPSNLPSGIVARDINGNFSASNITVTGLITESVSGSLTSGIYKSSSISGINNTTYLHNFIIDGGTP